MDSSSSPSDSGRRPPRRLRKVLVIVVAVETAALVGERVVHHVLHPGPAVTASADEPYVMKTYRYLSSGQARRIGRIRDARRQAIAAARAASANFDQWLRTVPQKARRTGKWFTLRMGEPGLAELGALYLDLNELDPQGGYLERAATIQDVILRRQLRCGGWHTEVVFPPDPVWDREVGYVEGEPDWPRRPQRAGRIVSDLDFLGRGMLRERPTTHALIFLMRAEAVLPAPRTPGRGSHNGAARLPPAGSLNSRGPAEYAVRSTPQAIRNGLDFVLASQLPDGAWQDIPGQEEEDDYRGAKSFNDGTINDCIAVLLAAYQAGRGGEYLAAARRGGEFIIRAQLRHVHDGHLVQAAWAQHYSLRDGRPRPGRPFEPASASSRVTARNVGTLIALYRVTGEERFLEPIPPALDWLDRVRLPAPPRPAGLPDEGPGTQWSMFYALPEVAYPVLEPGQTRPTVTTLPVNTPIFPINAGPHKDQGWISLDVEEGRRDVAYGFVGEFGVGTAFRQWSLLKDGRVSEAVISQDRLAAEAARDQALQLLLAGRTWREAGQRLDLVYHLRHLRNALRMEAGVLRTAYWAEPRDFREPPGASRAAPLGEPLRGVCTPERPDFLVDE